MIKKILLHCGNMGCSDVHLSAKTHITMRLHGDITNIKGLSPFTSEQVYQMIKSITSKTQWQNYIDNLEIDFSIQLNEDLRYRVNAFHTINGPAAVFRHIPLEIKSLKDLHVPPIIQSLAKYQNGLVLICGPTGSGKSTTISSLINHINETTRSHIITIEDPVEFIHKNKKSIINQREVGSNTKSFPLALRNVLREDPDVILVGEMRDLETMQLTLTAAETGHLVFATLHTSSSVHTINRIIDVFPPRDKSSVRSMLSSSLKAVLSQHLVIGKDGLRYPATELMFVNNSIRNLIRDDKVHQINSIIEISKKDNMYLMRDSINDFLEKGIISEDTAQEGFLYCGQ
ncbi:MAG: twitching motility protein PilT [Rickettsiales bacterium]|jgi:twitching motility protein PilT|nr:twitching motility protein PilT [Rickettsiales bacterium]|tara:strand:- start:9045 stop:10076 length:1032 start_codon:yes stop_codon:yes gene_type:complete